MSLTDRSVPARKVRMSRRRGSATALKMSEVVAARGTVTIVFPYGNMSSDGAIDRPYEGGTEFLPGAGVLAVRHVLHPVDRFAIKPFLNRDVGHARCGCRTVPMLLAGCEPDHVTGP